MPPSAPTSSIQEGLELAEQQERQQSQQESGNSTAADVLSQGVDILDALGSLSDIACDVGGAVLSTAGDVLSAVGQGHHKR